MEIPTDFPDIYLVTATMKTFLLTVTLYQAYFSWFFSVTKPGASWGVETIHFFHDFRSDSQHDNCHVSGTQEMVA